MKGKIGIGIVGAIVVAFTLAVFFIRDFERAAVHWWALSFLLLAEVVFFCGLLSTRGTGEKQNTVLLNFGLSTTLFLYLVATAVISVLLTGVFADMLRGFVLLNLAIIAVTAIIAVLLLVFSRRTARQNMRDAEKVHQTEAKRGGF